MSASTTIAPQDTKTYNIDRKLTASDGSEIVGLHDSNVSIGDGGIFSITSANSEIAKAGLDAARALSSGANEIAAQVADSQRAFVETASGQKTFLWGALILAILGFFLFRKK